MQQYKHEFFSPNEMLEVYLDFRIDTGSVVNKHFHDWIEAVYLIHGDLEFQDNNTVRHLKEGEFVVVNPMSIHSTRCMHGNTAILLQIPITFLEKLVPDIRQYVFAVDYDSQDARVQTKLREIESTLQSLWIAYQFHVDGYQFRCYSLIFELIYARYFDVDNFLITAKDIEGPWSEPVYLHSSGFDASILHDTNGKKYVVSLDWETREGYEKPGAICMVEYSPEKKEIVGYPKRIWRGGTDRGCIEAPHL